MRIAYLTTDEVNEQLAVDLADEYGASLHVLSPRDPAPDGEFDGVLYDLDHLPPSQRQKLLSALLAGSPLDRVAVHSYSLEECQIDTLRAHGVDVHRRLEGAVFQSLCRARDQVVNRNTEHGLGFALVMPFPPL
jgi:hypothetical protein